MFIIDKQEQFEELCCNLKKEPIIFMDTEFCRRHSYYAKLSLIQIGTHSQQFIVDALPLKTITPIADIMNDAKICKVLHAADQDLDIFLHLLGKIPSNIFDTQIAAGVIGMSAALGYGALCKSLLNINLDKTLQKANWLKRPLTDELIKYAVNDIKYLVPLYREITYVLDKRQLWDTYQSRSAHLYKPESYKISAERFVKRAGLHDRPRKLRDAYICMLLFREECAQTLDVPRNHCASEEELLKLARSLPTDSEKLQKLHLAYLPMTHKRFRDKLFELCLGIKEELSSMPQ